jgi:hypothetical protein
VRKSLAASKSRKAGIEKTPNHSPKLLIANSISAFEDLPCALHRESSDQQYNPRVTPSEEMRTKSHGRASLMRQCSIRQDGKETVEWQ